MFLHLAFMATVLSYCLVYVERMHSICFGFYRLLWSSICFSVTNVCLVVELIGMLYVYWKKIYIFEAIFFGLHSSSPKHRFSIDHVVWFFCSQLKICAYETIFISHKCTASIITARLQHMYIEYIVITIFFFKKKTPTKPRFSRFLLTYE